MVEGHSDGPILDGAIMHRGGGVKGDETTTPGKFLKNLLKKCNKTQKGDPTWKFFLESLDLPEGFWQKFELPPPLDFQFVSIYGCA